CRRGDHNARIACPKGGADEPAHLVQQECLIAVELHAVRGVRTEVVPHRERRDCRGWKARANARTHLRQRMAGCLADRSLLDCPAAGQIRRPNLTTSGGAARAVSRSQATPEGTTRGGGVPPTAHCLSGKFRATSCFLSYSRSRRPGKPCRREPVSREPGSSDSGAQTGPPLAVA